MGPEIRWTKKAISTFEKRIAYLEKHWTEREVKNFIARVSEYLNTLKQEPEMYRLSLKVKHTHIGVIIKQVSLVYRVKPKSDIIELLAFIDSRQNPKRNRYK